ncbi:hypothetical protein JI435_308800, partial [Parastagonospora nodorum SN15]
RPWELQPRHHATCVPTLRLVTLYQHLCLYAHYTYTDSDYPSSPSAQCRRRRRRHRRKDRPLRGGATPSRHDLTGPSCADQSSTETTIRRNKYLCIEEPLPGHLTLCSHLVHVLAWQ